jgi:hypothetical protein
LIATDRAILVRQRTRLDRNTLPPLPASLPILPEVLSIDAVFNAKRRLHERSRPDWKGLHSHRSTSDYLRPTTHHRRCLRYFKRQVMPESV